MECGRCSFNDIGPIVATVKLVRRTYGDLPFLSKVAKAIVHTKGADLTQDQFFELARTIESLRVDEPQFQNVVVREISKFT